MNRPKMPMNSVAEVFSVFLLLSALVADQPSAPLHPPPHYQVIELPLLPLHITNSDEVVGSVRGRAAMWSRERGLRLLPSVAGLDNSDAYDSNHLRHVVGAASSTDRSRSQAFIFKDGKLILLAGDGAKAVAMNDSDDVAGESRVAGKKLNSPVLWKAGSLIDLGACCGGAATGINSHGQVVGEMYDREGRFKAFLWDQEKGIRPVGASDVTSSAIAINEQGHVLVSEFDKGAFVYLAEGSTIRLSLSPNTPSKVRGMNNMDAVVGAYGSFADVARAFMWDKQHGFQDLNDLIRAKSGWTLESAVSINDRGEIVGRGDYNDEEDKGFLLIPE